MVVYQRMVVQQLILPIGFRGGIGGRVVDVEVGELQFLPFVLVHFIHHHLILGRIHIIQFLCRTLPAVRDFIS